MSNLVHEGAFDFSGLIKSALEGYIARPAIEQSVLEYLTTNRTGCCVVVGEPGSGKTALAASLIQSGGYIHHFLRAGHTEFSLWREPYAFLTSVGFQLKGIYGDALYPETIGMDIRGEVRDVDNGGSFIGAEIQQLLSVPWHSANLKVRLEAAGIKGKAIGVRIQQVVEDYRRVPLRTFANMALFDPMRRLAQLQPDARVVLWIDGLDEAFDRLPSESSAEGGHSLVDILPLTDEIQELGNLLLVISSRPTVELDRFIQSGARKIDLADARFANDNTSVIEQYIDREFATEEVRREVAKSGNQFQDIKQAVVTASGHNLLYLRQFFFGLRNGDLAELLGGGLPTGLDNIYARQLGRVARQAGDKYLAECHPLMTALAVAERGLTAEHLEGFTGLDRNRVNAAVGRVRPFLDIERIEKRNTYGLYHRSFRDCLVRTEHQDEVWYVRPEAAHDAIASYYLSRFQTDWQKMDDYGFDFLVHHLAHAGEAKDEQLFSLLGEGWRKAKRRHYRSNRQFSQDLAVAAQRAQLLPFPEAAIKTAQLALMDTLIADTVGQLPAGALELMIRLGEVQRAFDYIRPDQDPVVTVGLFAEMICGFGALKELGRRSIHRLLEQGLELTARDPDQSHGLLRALLKGVPASAESPMPELLQRTVEIFNSGRGDWDTPLALSELARLLVPLDRPQAGETFRQSLDACQKSARSSYSVSLQRILCLWADFDAREAAGLLQATPIHKDADGIRTAVDVLSALDPSGATGVLHQNYDLIRDLLPDSENPFNYALASMEVAALELKLGESSRAANTMTEVLAAIARIGGADDPERDIQNRLDQATTAWIHAASVDVEADPSRGRSTLQHAWTALQSHQPWNTTEDLQMLVQAQLRANPDLLQPRIETTTSHNLRAELFVGAGLALLQHSPALAATYLDQSLMLCDSSRLRDAGHAEFCLAIAHALGNQHRDEAQCVISEAGLAPQSIITWRLAILDQLLQIDQREAAVWWEQTWRYWLSSASNPNYLCELPAVIPHLPLDWVQTLAAEIETISVPTHKRLLAAAVSATIKSSGEVADRLLCCALDGLEQPLPDGFPARRILAFAAGQWWKVDQPLAESFWIRALLHLENDPAFAGEPVARHTHLTHLIEDAMHGAPSLALSVLLTSDRPPLPPDSILFRLPGPNTPAHLSAGIPHRDYLLAFALGREACELGPVRQQITTVAKPAIRALAACRAASFANDASLDERLAWCEIALDSVDRLPEHYLRCLFSADAASAFYAIGVKSKAVEIATATAQEILEHGEYFESIFRQPAYSHALGGCLRIIFESREISSISDFIWGARCLGIGLQTALGYLAQGMVKESEKAVHDFREAERQGTSLFV